MSGAPEVSPEAIYFLLTVWSAVRATVLNAAVYADSRSHNLNQRLGRCADLIQAGKRTVSSPACSLVRTINKDLSTRTSRSNSVINQPRMTHVMIAPRRHRSRACCPQAGYTLSEASSSNVEASSSNVPIAYIYKTKVA